MQVNRGAIHRTIALIIIFGSYGSAAFYAFTMQKGLLHFITCVITVLGFFPLVIFIGMYIVYSFTMSDKKTFAEWLSS